MIETPDQPIPKRKMHVLIAPLDWGLGHATRCIPIIRYLFNNDIDVNVIIAASGPQRTLLEEEFPAARFVTLKGYNLQYGSSGWATIGKIFLQIPKILKAIRYEKKWLDEFSRTNNIDAVISDNRYGLYTTSIPCIFMTHQLYIKTPAGKLAENLLQKINYRFINRFNECWVPDYNDDRHLAGLLSSPRKLPRIPVKYLGHLSRMKKENKQKRDQLLIILSGPEPQRSIFENIILQQLKTYYEPVIIARGLPGAKDTITPFNNITIYNYLNSRELNELINENTYIISRPGYSTVMDVLPLSKRCIFVPTPGQTEQEYLAVWLSGRQLCVTETQNRFSLQSLLAQAKELPVQQDLFTSGAFENVLEEFCNSIRKG